MGFEARFSPPFVSVAEFITVRFQPQDAQDNLARIEFQ